MTKCRRCNEKYFKLIPKDGDIKFQEQKLKTKQDELDEWHQYLKEQREKDKIMIRNELQSIRKHKKKHENNSI